MLPTCQPLQRSPLPGSICWVHSLNTKIDLPTGLRDCDQCVYLGCDPSSQTCTVERNGQQFRLRSKLVDHLMAWNVGGEFIPETDDRAKRALRSELAGERDPDRAALIEWFISRSS